MYIIGVDPGKSGAAAHIVDGKLTRVVSFNGEIENCRMIASGSYAYTPTYFIERVTASPNMGVVSAFTFGRWFEAVFCTATLSRCAVHLVRPTIWQNAIGVFSGGDKSVLYNYAKKLYPTEFGAKVFNKATSDAVLIAHYGWRYMVNNDRP